MLAQAIELCGGRENVTLGLDKHVFERMCPTLSCWVQRGKRLRVPPAVAVPARILLAGALGFYGTGLCCGLLWSAIDPAGSFGQATTAARAAIEAGGLMACLGPTCLIAISSLFVLRPVLGRLGMAAASLAALVALGYCVNDSFPLSEYLLYYWPWRVATLWCMLLGAGLGVALTGRRRGARFLWIPVTELLVALATLRIVFDPILSEVAK